MLKYLIDTNFLKFLMSPNGQHLTQKVSCNMGQMGISVISSIEVEYALAQSKVKDQDAKAAMALLSCFQLLPFDQNDAVATGKIMALMTSGRRGATQRGFYDIQIAGQAIAKGLTLVTNREPDYAGITGLRVSNWLVD